MDKIEASKTILSMGIKFYLQVLKNKDSYVPKKFGDFRHSFVVRFPPQGSSVTQPHNLQEFDFVVVAPIGFSIIHERFSIETVKLMNEISKEEINICKSNIFDKGKLMLEFESCKYKFMNISHTEATNIVNYLQPYSKCISSMVHSFFPRLLGIFSFKYPAKSQKLSHYLLFHSRIPKEFKMHQKFELYFNEKYDTTTDKRKPERTISNNGMRLSDFRYNFPDGLLMNQKQRVNLFNILDYDFELLRTLRIFNFSFRLYIHNFNLSKREMQNDEAIRNKRNHENVAPSILEPIDLPDMHKEINYKFNMLNFRTKERPILNANTSSRYLYGNFAEDDYVNRMSIFSKSDSYDSLMINDRIHIHDKPDKKKKNTGGWNKTNLFSSSRVRSNFILAKRHGAMFVYDIKGEYLAVFCVFGHVTRNSESSLGNWKAVIKSAFPNFCTQHIVSSATYSDKFENFLKHQVFKPANQDMFEAWPDDSKAFDEERKNLPKAEKFEGNWRPVKSIILDYENQLQAVSSNTEDDDDDTTTGSIETLKEI